LGVVQGAPAGWCIFRMPALPPLIGLALGLAVVLGSAGPAFARSPATDDAAPGYATPGTVWSFNLYEPSVVRFQNPDWRACTGAATLSMLNTIAVWSNEDQLLPLGGRVPRTALSWQIDTSYETQENILAYERNHMTMGWDLPGTDPHGWRNGLNYFGWGSINAGVYRDSVFNNFNAAARSTVVSLARHDRPVGILGWAGSHAQYVTGYTVRGGDPRVSDDWTLLGVFLTDPLQADQTINEFVTYNDWQYGPMYTRLSPYWHRESWAKDPIDGAVGAQEWWGKYVIIDAVK